MQRILDFLKENPTFYYASVDGDKPRVRPFGFHMEHEGKLYFGTGKHKQFYKQVIANSSVEICTADKDGKWIRIRGTAVFDERNEITEKVFELMPRLKDIYNKQGGPTFCSFYIKDGEAEIADMQGHFEKFTF